MSDSESDYSSSAPGSDVSVSGSSSEAEKEAIDKKNNVVDSDTEVESSSKDLLFELTRIRDLSGGMDDVLRRLRLMYVRKGFAEEVRGEMDMTWNAGERQGVQWQASSNCIPPSSSTENKPVLSSLSAASSVLPAKEFVWEFVSHGFSNSGVCPLTHVQWAADTIMCGITTLPPQSQLKD